MGRPVMGDEVWWHPTPSARARRGTFQRAESSGLLRINPGINSLAVIVPEYLVHIGERDADCLVCDDLV
ncbi:MAG: hypothetical protein NVS3B21_28420 [Acidimicrobiales bacterium]